MKSKKINIYVACVLVIVFVQTQIFASEYTNSFTIRVTEDDANGDSATDDPVEAFNNAVERATKIGQTLAESEISAQSSVKDYVLDSSWIKQEAHVQVSDLQVMKYRFVKPQNDHLRAYLNVKMQMDYVDVPKFMEDYQKTVTGAAYRSMAVPGWGQFYNRQYMTGILYGGAFWTFYLFFISAAKSATNSADLTSAALNFQLPAVILWSFNVSEAAMSRIMGRQGLQNLQQAYQFKTSYGYESQYERAFKIDLLLYTFSF